MGYRPPHPPMPKCKPPKPDDKSESNLPCEYCGRTNPGKGTSCIGCGAPVETGVRKSIHAIADVIKYLPPPVQHNQILFKLKQIFGVGKLQAT